ncbi:MAG: FG-GAP repeat protein, partial [Planctomycetes bacterium]|nr:FG-GAP repeat protein [Planctomycetota bacterium]
PTQLFKLRADDGAPFDWFGHSVAISGTTGIVGAYSSGAAYLFDTTTGKQLAKLLPNGGALGNSVAISSATAIVGAPGDDNSGSAYLFDISDPANPTQIAKLLADDGGSFDFFGHSIAISGATAIVGALGHDDNGYKSGSAYLFDISDPPNPVQTAKLLADDGAMLDIFGNSVAISVTTAIVGASGDDDACPGDPFCNSGSAYLFDAAAPGTCPWDLDGSGDVNVLDLLALLAAWGSDPGGPPDFDGDGTVGILDLLTLLANWGPCA